MKGCETLSRFNLLDEPWIPVVVDEKGKTRDVSLQELFAGAHSYLDLAGDMKAQDFAVLRLLLAVLHTVFSRVDARGEPYPELPLDDRFLPKADVADSDAYLDEVMDTWFDLWEAGQFPAVIGDYLAAWHDRFYLFDEAYPFYQVPQAVVAADKLNKSEPTAIAGKNINRLISESGNKISLFSPKYEAGDNKNRLTSQEVIRWLLTFQGYCGLSDKVIFGKEKYKASKGWIFDLGGVILNGKNLFETLMLNLLLVHPEQEAYSLSRQTPCWEFSGAEIVRRSFEGAPVDNLAALYTNWGRAIYMDPETDLSQPFSFQIVKLPEIDHQNAFIEPMTLWRYNQTGPNKDQFTPRKHRYHQSLWRSFGLLTLTGDAKNEAQHHKPAVISWYKAVKKNIHKPTLALEAISMEDNGGATSWVPINMIYDRLIVGDFLLTDLVDQGWVARINDEVDLVKLVVDGLYRGFMKTIAEIRNVPPKEKTGYCDRKSEALYAAIDGPFRQWLASLQANDDKEQQMTCWRQTLNDLALQAAEEVWHEAGTRDFKGIVTSDEQTENIATAYNRFSGSLHKRLS